MFFLLTKIILYLAQGFALCFAIMNWNRYKDGSQRFFLHFMVYVIVTEIVGFILANYTDINNTFVYNTYVLVSFTFYFYWFLRVLPDKKRIIQIVLVFFLGVFIYTLFTEQFFSVIFIPPFLLGALSILILVSLLFSDMLKNEDGNGFKYSQKFWFATGLLIFNIGFLPILFFQNVLDSHSTHLGLIKMILNVLLYGCFIIGFSVKIKE